MPQPGGRAAAPHRRHGMVRQVLHEHATSLSAAGHANRSRRLDKCAKDSGHYRRWALGTMSHSLLPCAGERVITLLIYRAEFRRLRMDGKSSAFASVFYPVNQSRNV